MASVVVLPQATYPIGTRSFGPVTVPTGIGGVQIQLDGALMTDAALHVVLSLDLSIDSGATWASSSPSAATNPFPVQLTLNGGMKDRAGNALATYFLGCDMPAPSNPNRRLQGALLISGQALTTKATVVTS